MATVNGLSKERMLEIEAASVVDGHVVGDDLMLTKHDGTEFYAGNVRGPKGDNAVAGRRWANGQAYNVNDTVGYSGRLYSCIQANTDKCPPFNNNYWAPVTGSATDVWPLADPYFMAEDLDGWEFFWRSGTTSASLTQVAGEFESGYQALKINLDPSSSQRFYERGEVLVRGNEVITVTIRAKLVGAAAVAPVISVGLFQSTKDGRPEPFGPDASEAGGTPLYGTVGAAWATFTYTIQASLAKPRSRLNILVQQGAGNSSTVVIDRVEVSRFAYPLSLKADKTYVDTQDAGLQSSINLKAAKTDVDSADLLLRLGASAQRLMNGGGLRAVDSTGVSWNQRFIMMGNGQQAGEFSQGYIAFTMPPDGTVIPVYGHPTVTSVTVASGKIPMTNWYALYYEFQPGDSAAQRNDRWKIVYYTAAMATVPPNWIFVVMRNGDSYAPMYFWGDGRYQDVWRALTPASGWASSPSGTQKLAACYRDGNVVRFRGVITGTLNAATTTQIATVPLEYRPDNASNFITVGSTGGFSGWCNVTDAGVVSVHFKSPYASGTATLELSAVSYIWN